MRATAALVAAALVAGASAVEPQVDRGNVLVYKELRAPETKDILVVGKPFTVTYMVFNMGKGDAKDVKVRDEFPADSFEVVEGVPEKSWAVLAGCVPRPRPVRCGGAGRARATVAGGPGLPPLAHPPSPVAPRSPRARH